MEDMRCYRRNTALCYIRQELYSLAEWKDIRCKTRSCFSSRVRIFFCVFSICNLFSIYNYKDTFKKVKLFLKIFLKKSIFAREAIPPTRLKTSWHPCLDFCEIGRWFVWQRGVQSIGQLFHIRRDWRPETDFLYWAVWCLGGLRGYGLPIHKKNL